VFADTLLTVGGGLVFMLSLNGPLWQL
jgi:hypothetical protein